MGHHEGGITVTRDFTCFERSCIVGSYLVSGLDVARTSCPDEGLQGKKGGIITVALRLPEVPHWDPAPFLKRFAVWHRGEFLFNTSWEGCEIPFISKTGFIFKDKYAVKMAATCDQCATLLMLDLSAKSLIRSNAENCRATHLYIGLDYDRG